MMMSFVIPAYNEEMYLPACLESILKEAQQTELETEIIVVNNASTDRTRQVAAAFPGVLVVDEMRKGLPYARQAGFEACRGDLIANVDADSRLPAGWMKQVMQQFALRPEMLAVSGPLVYYDLTPAKLLLVQVFYATAFMTYVLNRYVLRAASMVQGGNFVITRKGMEALGGFDTTITFYGEDTDIARRLNEHGEVRFTFDLKMNSSARRLKHEGILMTAMRYSINYFWTTFRERPFTTEHVDIREEAEGRV